MRKLIPLLGLLLVLGACETADVTQETDDNEAISDVVESEPTVDATPTEETEEEEVAEQQNLEVAEYGFSTFEVSYDDSVRASYGAIITNPNDDHWAASSVNITITLMDDDGSVVHSADDTIAFILPGQHVAIADTTFEDVREATEMRIQARARNWEEVEGPFGSFTPSDVNLRANDMDGWTVTGQVASDFVEDFEDVYVVAVFRDSNENVIGGEWGFIDFIPAGGDTSFELSGMDSIQDVAAAEVYVHFSSMSVWR